MRYKASPVEQLVGRLPVSNRLGLDEIYRNAINVMRAHSANAVIRIALEQIQANPEDPQSVLESLPWLHLLLVKWALQDNRVPLLLGAGQQRYDSRRHNDLVRKIWLFDSHSDDMHLSNDKIMRMLRRVMHMQSDVQRYSDASFLRWPALLQRLPSGHKANKLFEEAMGMPPSTYSDLSTVIFATALQSSSAPLLDPRPLRTLLPVYGNSLEHYLSLFTRTTAQLRFELQKDAALKIRGINELYEFPYLHRFPLLDLEDGNLYVWHPLVFSRGIENGVHNKLTQFGQRYTESYSLIFQDYVTDLALKALPNAITEENYKRMCGDHSSVVEAAINLGSCNLFIEAKMSLFHDDVILTDDPLVLSHKTERVRKAIAQGMNVSRAVRCPDSPFHQSFGAAACDYMLVVTSRDLMLITGERLQQLMPGHSVMPSGIEVAEHLPLHNVFIVDILDYELIMAGIAAGKVDLPGLLERAALANRSHVTGRIHLREHLNPSEQTHRIAPLLEAEFDSAKRRVASCLGHHDV